jgi:hypothetical protein
MNEVLTIVGISSEVVGVANILTSKFQVLFSNRKKSAQNSTIGTKIPYMHGCLVVRHECDGFVAKSSEDSLARKSQESSFLHSIRQQASRRWEKPLERFIANEKLSAYAKEQFF